MWYKAERFLLKDPIIGPLIKKYGHCTIRSSKTGEYFADLVEAICSQQLSGKAAETIFNRVRVGLGGVVSPTAIFQTKDSDFRKWGLSKQKTSYLKDLSEKVERGVVKISRLDKLSDEEVTKELVAVKGIGRWTAEMFLMFSLARPDVFPIDDLGIKKGTEKLLGISLNSQKLGKIIVKWKPYRSLASWYIWKSLDNR